MKPIFQNAKIVTDGYRDCAPRGNPGYVMSYSGLKDFADCPHKWLVEPKEKPSAAMVWGDLVDTICFEPMKFGERFAVRPNFYTDENGNQKPWHHASNTCKLWLQENVKGREIVESAAVRDANEAIDSIKDAGLWGYLSDSQVQVRITADYTDERTGLVIPFGFTPDSVPNMDDCIADLKKCYSIPKFESQVWTLKYFLQAWMYQQAWLAATGERKELFFWVVVEDQEPFEAALIECDPAWLEMGEIYFQNSMRLYCDCLASNTWPGYGVRVCSPKPWQIDTVKRWHVETPETKPIESEPV